MATRDFRVKVTNSDGQDDFYVYDDDSKEFLEWDTHRPSLEIVSFFSALNIVIKHMRDFEKIRFEVEKE